MIRFLFVVSVICFFYTLSYSQDVKKKKQEEGFICYYPVEIETAFPGGEDAWKSYLDTNFAKLDIASFYPNPKRDSTISVLIEFTIDTVGNIAIKREE